MALILCKNCKENMADDKKGLCKDCLAKGAGPSKWQSLHNPRTQGWLILAAVILFIALSTKPPWRDRTLPEPVVKTAEELRADRISAGFSKWDGSHRDLTRIVKAAMHDPKSFEHVETVYWDKGNYLMVRMQYRGKNAFGAMVINSVTAYANIDGDVFKILDE